MEEVNYKTLDNTTSYAVTECFLW